MHCCISSHLKCMSLRMTSHSKNKRQSALQRVGLPMDSWLSDNCNSLVNILPSQPVKISLSDHLDWGLLSQIVAGIPIRRSLKIFFMLLLTKRTNCCWGVVQGLGWRLLCKIVAIPDVNMGFFSPAGK